jgi:predicted permease
LVFIAVGKIIKKPSIFDLALVKMLFIHVSMYLLLGFFLPQTPRMILTLIVGLPSMTTVAMVATAYQSDDEYATEIIFKDRLILF